MQSHLAYGYGSCEYLWIFESRVKIEMLTKESKLLLKLRVYKWAKFGKSWATQKITSEERMYIVLQD